MIHYGQKALKYGRNLYTTYKLVRPVFTTPSKRGYNSTAKRYRVPKWMPYGRGLIQRGYSTRRRVSKKSWNRRRLLKLGVTANSQPTFLIDNDARRIECPQGFKTFQFLGPGSYGVNSKRVCDAIASHFALTDPEAKICLARQQEELMISNSSNGGVYISVVWMKFKKQWTATMGASINADFLEVGFGAVGMASSANQLLNATYLQNKKMMTWMEPVKTQKTFLSAGGTRKFTYLDKNIYRKSLQYKSEPDIDYLRGEIIPLIIFHGTPVHDDTTPFSVTTAASALDIIRHFSVKTYPITLNGFTVVDTDGLGTVTTPVRYIDNDKTEVSVTTGA